MPENWIRPTGEETSSLVNYLAQFIAKHPKSASCCSLFLDHFIHQSRPAEFWLVVLLRVFGVIISIFFSKFDKWLVCVGISRCYFFVFCFSLFICFPSTLFNCTKVVGYWFAWSSSAMPKCNVLIVEMRRSGKIILASRQCGLWLVNLDQKRPKKRRNE